MIIKYRKATIQDSRALKSISKRIITTNYAPFLGYEATAAYIESGMSDKEIEDGINSCTVMMLDDEVAGFFITKAEVLHLIMVDTPYQNKGYGSLLLSYTESILFKKFERIRLQTFRNNEFAIKFYLTKGWTIVNQQHAVELDSSLLYFEKNR